MSKNSNNSWGKTRKIYINWLSDSELRLEFSKKIKYDNLSLWWLSKLVEKDNENEVEWYENLHKKFNKEKIKLKNNYYIFALLTKKIFKRFIGKIIFTIFIKVFFKEKKNNLKNKKNYFYARLHNLVMYQNKYIDRNYGLATLNNNNNIYLIEMQESYRILLDFFKIRKKLSKVPSAYLLTHHHISIFEIIKVYLFTIRKLFTLLSILNKKNYFYLNNVNCENILKKQLIESFFGPIQDQLLMGIALKNTLKKISCKNFINCFDFFPQSRVLYYFARNNNVKNIININHCSYSENRIFFNFNKRDFSNNTDLAYYSPRPDVFFCQGNKYFKKLKTIFKKEKIYKIGSLKIELLKSMLAPRKINKNKKILVIVCGISDYHPFIKLLNLCDLEKFQIIVAPHPLTKTKTIYAFKKNFNKKFITSQNFNMTKLFRTCDFVIFGNTSLGLELSRMNYNTFRVYDKEYLPTFDLDKEIPTATNSKMITQLLKKKKIPQKASLIERNYFFKYDKKASDRFYKIIESKNFK